MEIRFEFLAKAISDCWKLAEQETAVAILEKCPCPSEEQITFLFGGELRKVVRTKSDGKAFSAALIRDLESSIPNLPGDVNYQLEGLVARVNIHSRHHEGRESAADLGVIVARPKATLDEQACRVDFETDYSRALLAQAKLETNNVAKFIWRGLTKKQCEIIPSRRDYTALLLYSLSGEARETLEPFRWQLCRGYEVSDITSWLKSGRFPKCICSDEIIHGLSVGDIGTDEVSIVSSIADPPSTRPCSIEIRVYWPDGKGPGSGVLQLANQVESQRVATYQ